MKKKNIKMLKKDLAKCILDISYKAFELKENKKHIKMYERVVQECYSYIAQLEELLLSKQDLSTPIKNNRISITVIDDKTQKSFADEMIKRFKGKR